MSAAPDRLGEYLAATHDEAVAFGSMITSESMVTLAKAYAEESRKRWIAAKATVASLVDEQREPA